MSEISTTQARRVEDRQDRVKDPDGWQGFVSGLRTGFRGITAALRELNDSTATFHAELRRPSPDFWKLFDIAHGGRLNLSDTRFPDPIAVLKEKIAGASAQHRVWYRELLREVWKHKTD